MKVALFVHCFYPSHIFGTETYTLELARNLKALGHDPTVVSATFPGEPVQPELLHRYEFDGIPVISIDKNRFPNLRIRDTYYQAEMVPLLGELVDDLQPDIVHVTHLINHTSALLDAMAPRSIPMVATFTDFFGFCYNNRLEAHDGRLCPGPSSTRINCIACHIKAAASAGDGWRNRWLRSPNVARVAASSVHALRRVPWMRSGHLAEQVDDLVERPSRLHALYPGYRTAIVPTRFTEQAYRGNGFEPPMVRIPFGVDIARHAKPRGRNRPLTLGFIGQLMEHKGPDILIDAARDTLGCDGYELRLYGSEAQAPHFAKTLRQRTDGMPVRFMGTFPPEQMRAVFDDLDVLVIPSRWYENSPLVLLNALASHTPAIVSDVEGMTEFVQNRVNGMTFERGDARSLAKVLRTIANDRAVLERLADTANYEETTRSMTLATLDVYRRALNAAGSA